MLKWKNPIIINESEEEEDKKIIADLNSALEVYNEKYESSKEQYASNKKNLHEIWQESTSRINLKLFKKESSLEDQFDNLVQEGK